METKRWWIVGHDDKAWGPFEKPALAVLAAERKLRADGLVCAEGDTRWSPIGSRAELSEIAWPPVPESPPTSGLPPASVAAPGAPAIPADLAILRTNDLDPIPGWATVLLSIPTLGLWGTFNFYRTMRVYRRIAGVTSNVETLFWTMLAVTALGVITLPVGVGVALVIGAVVVGALLVRETLRLRDLAILRLVPRAAVERNLYPAFKSDDWHFGLWITGAVLTVTGFFAIVGVPILIAQALTWFEEWNRFASLARGTRT
ncbi:MAG TPA: DUF4339 domain-containing protein [Planctomycetota bacterium]|nr:DUF4339 domain-containing protein [Planctomycetota bacterium]